MIRRASAEDRPALPCDLLVDRGDLLHQRALRRVDHEVALAIHFETLRSIDGEVNGPRVGAGSQLPIVFEVALAAVVGQVDAGIDRAVGHTGVGRDADVPAGRISADEVIDLARQEIEPAGAVRGVGADKPQAHG